MLLPRGGKAGQEAEAIQRQSDVMGPTDAMGALPPTDKCEHLSATPGNISGKRMLGAHAHRFIFLKIPLG